MRIRRVLLTGLLLLATVGCSAANGTIGSTSASVPTTEGSDPLIVDEVARISRQELRAGIEAGTITVVDTLPETMHQRQHLPGAVNIPGFPYEKARATTDRLAPRLLPDKSAKLALYCINPPCRNSEFVGRRLKELGYTAVHKYADGIQDWIAAGLPTEGTTADR